MSLLVNELEQFNNIRNNNLSHLPLEVSQRIYSHIADYDPKL